MGVVRITPVLCDLYVYHGDINETMFELVDPDMNPIDLTGSDVMCQVRSHVTASTVMATGVTNVAEGTSGRVTVAWSDAELSALLVDQGSQWRGVWDLQVVHAGELLPVTYLRGEFIVLMDVTRSV